MTRASAVPPAQIAFIGGTASRQGRFPEDLDDPDASVLARDLRFETPYGRSPRFKLWRLAGRGPEPEDALYVPFHGWREGVDRLQASEQVFWVLREAGVREVFVDGTVGAISPLLEPGDLVVPDDFVDERRRFSAAFAGGQVLRMQQPICPRLAHACVAAARDAGHQRVFRRGTYAVTEGPRLETPAEIRALRRLGADVVGQSLTPEAYLARAIGACYVGLYLVSNPAEGTQDREWTAREFFDFYAHWAGTIKRLMLRAIQRAEPPPADGCCDRYRLIPPPSLRANRPDEGN